jgi:hypothetical protein
LLDEADGFLSQDAQVGFRHTTLLKGMMDDTNRRFKVVFAGLHNVLRTTRLSNHPLAHFGDPIAIGPLIQGADIRAARALVEGPLGALGYRFTSPDLVFRILAQTNYYPSLIQLYGYHLLRHLGERLQVSVRSREYPPYSISSDHLDEAYGSRELREAIRQRFALTLQLDTRYEVIAYALGYAILERRLSLDEGASVDWLRSEALSWWGEGFTQMPEEDFRVLLDEMVGLGVFRPLEGARYTFRNANTLLLIGTEGEVASMLVRDREPPATFDAASFREPLRVRPERLSALTARQVATLKESRNAVSIVVGTPALGLEDLSDSLDQVLGAEFFRPLRHLVDRQAFDQALEHLESRAADGTTVLYVDWDVPWGPGWIKHVATRLKRLRSGSRFVRVVFVAASDALLQLVTGELDEIEGAGVELLSLGPWQETALQHWLDMNHLPTETAIRQRVRALTGNRPLLVYRFLQEAKHYAHWEQAARQFEADLARPEGRQDILTALGLGRGRELPHQVLRHLALLEREDQAVTSSQLAQALRDSGMDAPVDAILRWAELLQLVFKASADSWHLDRWVAPLLLEE